MSEQGKKGSQLPTITGSLARSRNVKIIIVDTIESNIALRNKVIEMEELFSSIDLELELGDSATLDIGTTENTVASGNIIMRVDTLSDMLTSDEGELDNVSIVKVLNVGMYSPVASGTYTADGYKILDGDNYQFVLEATLTREYFVDSVNGSDSNDGKTYNSPLQTISALDTLLDSDFSNCTIKIARGSVFYEQLGSETNGSANVKITTYGSGKLPIFDARDEIDTGDWVKTSGQTNVYEVTWTPLSDDKCAPSIWEDDIRLIRVADLATCDSTPGSYYASNTYSTGVSAALYMHATDSGNPASNGSEYKQAIRENGIYLGNFCEVENVRCIAGLHDNGCLVVGRYSTLINCIAVDGTKHHIFVGSGLVKDCICVKLDTTYEEFGGTTIVPFIAYNTANKKDGIRWEGCKVIGEDGDEADATSIGFYAHGQSSGGNDFGNVECINCDGYYLSNVFGGASQNESYLVDGCFAYNCGRFLASFNADFTVRRSEWFNTKNTSLYKGFFRPNEIFDSVANFEDCIAVVSGDAASNASNHPFDLSTSGNAGTVNLTRVYILAGSTTNYSLCGIKATGNATTNINVNKCLLQGWGQQIQTNYYNFGDNITYDGDYNVFNGDDGAGTERGDIEFDTSTHYDTATDYLAAVQPTIENNSISTLTDQFEGDILKREYTLIDGDAKDNDCKVRFTPRVFDYDQLVYEVENL
ncbi:hypothetical protein [Chondrinema litorale]|uniref:hypothetical protein n=1 Tax=Chondrinema litorale TaxID=2994555 RepID=UPI002542E6BE|nr:hypothetical protein [Chondrinema litorale]UZS00272.1 hypothetical protein OQ292_40740 [Chondrinema litorale]